MSNKTKEEFIEVVCEQCWERLEDCECPPGFPHLAFCPVAVYDPKNHDEASCIYCQQRKSDGTDWNASQVAEVIDPFDEDDIPFG